MLETKHFKELNDKGYTVVDNVISKDACDEAIGQYKDWLSNFGEGFPRSFQSLIKGYNIGHLPVTWTVRLKAKPVFSQLWKTEKLLTSIDGIAIGRPFDEESHQGSLEKYWLHADHTPSRIGLHAYQGSIFLEEQTKSDWTFQVIEGSHKYLESFFAKFPEKAEEAMIHDLRQNYRLTPGDQNYFEQAGCRVTRVPVPKGGMILWDSRLVHANARPLPNRKNKNRWRFVVFVSMTPAIWANETDMLKKREAYEKPTLTSHWSSQGVRLLEAENVRGIPCPTRVPEVARTDEVRKLCGVLPYDFNDGQPNGDEFRPVWRKFERTLAPELNCEAKFSNGHI